MKEQILVRITGQDRPGLTASVMEILAKYDTQILDIGQADIHATLSLGILIRVDEENSGRVMKELLFKATELQVNIGFYPYHRRPSSICTADCLRYSSDCTSGIQY